MSGKGGNSRRRPAKRRDQGGVEWQEGAPERKKAEKFRYDKNRGELYERPQWVPVKIPSAPLPVLDCVFCGKPIRDISAAITDRHTGSPAHFDCILSQIKEVEPLEQGDEISYIGGGRFGVVHFIQPRHSRSFKIKKILEWEDKEHRAEWRTGIADCYSLT
ncbi:MAG: hypothetical protein LBD37_09810 [Treponema sp.]|jgi:hypothetical protein|nr:hypothetical protein [Treponema sp.]